jgi:glycosyltransferase involved in cell wall biosynthesis
MLDISIIIPCYNEELFIENCIHSILNFTLEKGKYEIILIDGDSTDNTRDIIIRLKEKYSQIKLLINKERTVPYALNMGIKEAKGNIIVRMDAHSIYPSDYISVLVDLLRSEDVDNVGGIVETLPADKTTKSQCIAIASSHKFGVGDSHFRIGSKEIRKVDTVPFGCFKFFLKLDYLI